MMALTQENVHYTLNSDPGVTVFMRGSRNFCQAGGGGGGGSRPDGQKTVFSHQPLFLQFTEWIQWFYYRGEEGVQLLPGGGGVQRDPYDL